MSAAEGIRRLAELLPDDVREGIDRRREECGLAFAASDFEPPDAEERSAAAMAEVWSACSNVGLSLWRLIDPERDGPDIPG